MRRTMVVGLTVLVSGCMTPPSKPLVDYAAESDPKAYQKDLIECITLADYYLTSEVATTNKVVQESLMAGGGAVIGGAVMGSTASSIATGMTAGLIGGAIGGAINAAQENEFNRNRGTGRCLQGRGYEIINAHALWLDPLWWCKAAIGPNTWAGASKEQLDACVPFQEEWLRKAKEAKAAQKLAVER